jgi:thiamine phosphate synthase YjbQ (UPF0047 family)
MPQAPITQSINYTIGFLLLFLIAFFPGLPQYLISLPFRPFLSAPRPVFDIPICAIGCAPAYHSTSVNSPDMAWFQKTFTLPPQSRGSFLITDHVVKQLPEIKDYKVGLLHLFIQHTSCALSLNENWDSDVREDMSDALDRLAPEDRKGDLYRHSAEGLDDMPVRFIFKKFHVIANLNHYRHISSLH